MVCFRVLTTLFAAVTTVLANNECFVDNRAILLLSSTCADKGTLADCLDHIRRFEAEDMMACYEESGCSPEEAENEIELIIKACKGDSMQQELKRQDAQNSNDGSAQASATEAASEAVSAEQASNTDVAKTALSTESATQAASSSRVAVTETSTAASSAAIASTTLVSSTVYSSWTIASSTSSTTTSTTTQTGEVKSNEACFETTKSWKNICDLDVTGIHTSTVTCAWGEVTSSSCSANMICTTNASGDICMEMHGIDTGGVIIAVVLAVLFAALFGGVCLASVLEDRKRKRALARAEAAALARSASAKTAMLSDY